MNDILLWRLLTEGPNDAATTSLAPLLDQLAERPAIERFPFFGLLPRLLDQGDAGLRAATVRALAGASGADAFRHIVAGLHDTDPTVRLASVESLKKSAEHDSDRWIHVVFHRDPAVRRAAIVTGANPQASWMNVFLLADAELAGAVRANQSIERLSPAALPTLLDFAGRGVVTRGEARRFIVRIVPQSTLELAAHGPARAAAEIERVLESAQRPDDEIGDTAAGVDRLDELFDLFWDVDATDLDTRSGRGSSDRLFSELTPWLFTRPEAERQRVVASLIVTARRRGGWAPAASHACAAFWPEFFAFPWVAPRERREAAAAMYQLGSRCPRYDDARVRNVLEASPFRRPSGNLDLWFVGALLHFLQNQPYQKLQEWFTTGSIVSAFLENMVDSAPFFRLTDDSPRGRQFLIDEIARHRRPQRSFMLALLVSVLSADALDLLDPLDGQDVVDLVAELLKLSSRSELRLSDNKVARVAETLGAKMIGSAAACAAAPVESLAVAASAKEVTRTLVGQSPLFDGFLAVWLERPAAEEWPLGRAILSVVARELPVERLLVSARALDGTRLLRFLSAVSWCAGFPYGKERQLVEEFARHTDPQVREWAALRSAQKAGGTAPGRRPFGPARTLSIPERARIADSREDRLAAVVANCQDNPVRGLSAALARRPAPSAALRDVCIALLVSNDPPADVAREFVRFGSEEPSFLTSLETELVNRYVSSTQVGLLAHVWLYRWELHAFALFDGLTAANVQIEDFLVLATTLASPRLGRACWEAVESLFAIWRWRDKKHFEKHATESLGHALVDSLTTQFGDEAARLLMRVHQAGVAAPLMAALKLRVVPMLADLSESVRHVLSAWINSRGLAGMSGAARRVKGAISNEFFARIRRCVDLDQLAAWCCDDDLGVADEAILRLVDLSEAGVARLVEILRRPALPPAVLSIAATVSLWPAGAALDSIRPLASSHAVMPELQFELAASFVERGESEYRQHALKAASREAKYSWFRPEHWQRLERLGVSEAELAVQLVASPQPHAYTLAVNRLMASPSLATVAKAGLVAFLEAGDDRLRDLRIEAARWLRNRGNWSGFPVLLGEETSKAPQLKALLANAPEELVLTALGSFSIAGPRLAHESVFIELLGDHGVLPEARESALAELLVGAATEAVRNAVLAQLRGRPSRHNKLRRVAETFAWGVRRGRELTGRMFQVEMIAGEDLGYTRFNQNKVFVNPLPLLRREQDGEAVVRALIVHELGHHMYHRGPEPESIWERAAKQRLHSLLNLVADEHLERNLRALDAGFGDSLKKLTAYAFQHTRKEVPVERLLASLQGRAFEVLTSLRLGAARRRGCVVLESGAVLRELEKTGHSFARFVRALRMGLGNRHRDPQVAEALELFRGTFRQATMTQLFERVERLRAIFGWQVELLDMFCQERLLDVDPSELAIEGEGITNDELQSEIRRILDPATVRRGGDAASEGGGRWINISPSEEFTTITTIIPVPRDPAAHAEYAARVRRPARHMRRYFEQLGLALVPRRFRLRGRSFDRSRAMALVTRGDPRVLIAREPEQHTDLFLGVAIDCSGSMQVQQNIEKAKLFGTLLAEAVQGLHGVDLRLFGFTDEFIYDAGDASRCAVHALRPGGGNNDAAALWHAAQTARQSRRRARLVVMISDGLPTECSVAALRSLVHRVTQRMKICCAQVAVQKLEEVCFPHYVLLDDDDPIASVRRFGGIMVDLVQKTLRG